jgi:transposase InsO family protein
MQFHTGIRKSLPASLTRALLCLVSLPAAPKDDPQIPTSQQANGLRIAAHSISQVVILPPQANAFCERLIGTIRRECLDFLIPLGERHLRRILKEWVTHYNQGRPHSSLGPGIPNQ